MADKWQDLAGRLKNAGGGGAPRGLGLGMKLLGAGVAAVYGLQQSMYTGQAVIILLMWLIVIIKNLEKIKLSY